MKLTAQRFLPLLLLLAGCAAAPTPAAPAPLPPDPLPVEFQTADGLHLTGRYYPAAASPAPVVVLMHGGGGDLKNWIDAGLVAWLQNRGGQAGDPAATPLPEERSLAVFIFTYRGDWIEAGRAAVETAQTLPGADPRRIVTMGASVGADDATEACDRNGCLGALAFSPVGSLDGVRYADSVARLDRAGKLAWCIATDGDHGCPPAQGVHYRAIVYSGMAHGLQLFTPGRVPSIWQDTRAFLDAVFR